MLIRYLFVWCLLALLSSPNAWAEDWPAYQRDNSRSGRTAESLPDDLAPIWLFRSPHSPARGWGLPESTKVYNYGIRRIGKVRYDNAFPAVAVADVVFFASSAENKVYALDAATGEVRWVHFTRAAPRTAPCVYQGKVYFGADDGHVYCLQTKDGKEVWQFQAAPGDDRVISQGRIHSLWPVRTGVAVRDGIAYFGAGLFPAEGLRLYAVNADTGKLVWKNDSFDSGGGANLSPQGYLLLDEKRLIMPSGRVSPAVFDRQTGKHLFNVQNGRALTGGTYATMTPRRLFNGTQIISGYDLNNPVKDKYGRMLLGTRSFGWFNARRIIVHQGRAYLATANEILAIAEESLPEACNKVDDVRELRWKNRGQLSRYAEAKDKLSQAKTESLKTRYQRDMKRYLPQVEVVTLAEKKLNEYLDKVCRWRLPCQASEAMILAGNSIYAGGKDQFLIINKSNGKLLDKKTVDGTVRAFAAANGRLLVSTTQGHVYCYGKQARSGGRPVRNVVQDSVLPESNPKDRQFAANVLQQLQGTKGYCLVLGADDGGVVLELARQSDLAIYVLDPNRKRVEALRSTLDRAHLIGNRVIVEAGSLTSLPYPDYCANLVLDLQPDSAKATTPAEILRVLKPYGGLAVVRRRSTPAAAKQLKKALASAESDDVSVTADAGGARIRRGGLEGTGSWTHQYANPGNTSSSGDRLANAPFRMLWFGDPGPQGIVDRHAGAAAPLCVHGRMIVQGINRLQAFDAYNGAMLWERHLEGAMRASMTDRSSNLAAAKDSLFVVIHDHCLRLDMATGKTLQTYRLPARQNSQKRRWGWMAVVDGKLFGSRTETDRAFRHWPEITGNTSEAVFAIDVATGKILWLYEGKGIYHTALAVGKGQVYLLDATLTATEKQQAEANRKRFISKDAPPLDRRGKPRPRALVKVVALDAVSGKPAWSQPWDVSSMVIYPRAGQPNLLYAGDTVLLGGSPSGGDHHLREFREGHFASRSLAALSAKDGSVSWAGAKNYLNRPAIIGDVIYAEPWLYDLKTGKRKERKHPLTGKMEPWRLQRGAGGACGATSASSHTLFFRSNTGAYYDLKTDCGITRRGGQRLSCWINSITADGLLLIPEGSAECDCAYAIQCSTVLAPARTNVTWGTFRFDKPLVPVQHVAVNVGAPGDTRAKDGTVWLSCPNRVHKWNWASCQLQTDPPGRFYAGRNSVDRRSQADKKPWLFASGAKGISEFSIPLTEPKKRDRFTIRLSFMEPDPVAVGDRVFDVFVQGKQVLAGFDIVKETGGPYRGLVKEFKGIEVKGSLTISFKPAAQARIKQPLLCGVEAVRE